MCGITGLWVFNPPQPERDIVRESPSKEAQQGSFEQVMASCKMLKHRGPDGLNCWLNTHHLLALGHARLAIIDLSPQGIQPMHSVDGRFSLVFNGEIYNYIELRQEYTQRGYQFITHSDSEVLLAVLATDGVSAISKLRGMFAFALWDEVGQQLVLARDRLGKKPLYYFHSRERISFASEVQALAPLAPPDAFSLSESALQKYLTYGSASGSQTIYSGILELEPGSALTINRQGVTKTFRYWTPPTQKSKSHSESTLNKIEQLLEDAIKLRLRSDVPIGIFLSGGIDSGLIAYLASRHTRLSSFSVGFVEDPYDERCLARTTADHCRTDHHEILLQPKLAEDLIQILAGYGEPIADPSVIPAYYISRYASTYVKVILTGDGGDELFCGYRRHLAAAWRDRLTSCLPPPLIQYGSKIALKALPTTSEARSAIGFLRRFLDGVSTPVDALYAIYGSGGFTVEEQNAIRSNRTVLHAEDPLPQWYTPPNTSALDYLVNTDLFRALPDDLLVKMDIATMRFGMESRSPLLDQELVDFMLTLPNSCKVGLLTTKPLLRAIARRHLPDTITNQPKRGFEVPLERWLLNDLVEMRGDLLSPTGPLANIFAHETLAFFQGTPNLKGLALKRWATKAWFLLCFAIWNRYIMVKGTDNHEPVQ